jgi:hypothetical protein
MPDIVYILTNEAMPGLVKIGRTIDSVEIRIAQLSSSTAIPLAFECYFAAEVNNAAKLEKTLHQLFSENRINPKREFFRVDRERVVLAISIGDFKELSVGATVIDKEEQEALDKAKARRPRLRLDALGIKPGDVLTFTRDDSITAQVVENGRVLYQGEVESLSSAALKALHGLGYRTPSASGSYYWKYEGEILDERRVRMESEQFEENDNTLKANL